MHGSRRENSTLQNIRVSKAVYFARSTLDTATGAIALAAAGLLIFNVAILQGMSSPPAMFYLYCISYLEERSNMPRISLQIK